MKSILLIMFLLPLSVAAQQFSYDNISTGQKGADFITSDRSACHDAKGTIQFFRNRVVIDGEKFTVKKVRKDDIIKTDKGMIKVVYSPPSEGQGEATKKPAYVQVLRYNTLLTYHINEQEPEVAAVLNK
ncbi:MAG TPA: hypothetical protein VL093_14715 [Flavipsychrobacter sp.]|nr:hypothetical protein [Flavipsychrobacter sp.]